MKRQFALPVGAAAAMVVLTPTAIRTRSAPWASGWTVILLGAACLLMLLALVEHLTSPVDLPEDDTREA